MTSIGMRVEPPWDDRPNGIYEFVAGKGRKPKKSHSDERGVRYICSQCGKDCGTSSGAKGMLQMHVRAKYPTGGKQ